MSNSDAQLMSVFLQLRKTAFQKLATPLNEAVLSPFNQAAQGVKTASEVASIDKALFLHTSVP
jgi:hypothetical protein